MAALPPQMQQYIAMMLQKGGRPSGAPGAGGAPGGAIPMGGTPGINPNAPSPYGGGGRPLGATPSPPQLGGPPGPPSAVPGNAGRGPFPPGYSPQPQQPGPPPAGPGGGGTGIPMVPPQPGAGNRNVPPGAGGLFGAGSTAPMNPPRPTARPPAPPNMGPGGGGPSAIGAATTAGAVPPPAAGGVRPDAAAIGAINPSVFQEQQGLMNKQRAQANWLQGGAGIRDEGTHTRGKYGTYTAASPLSHATKAFARGKGMKDIKNLTEEEKKQIEELRGFRKQTGKAVRQAYGMGEPEAPGSLDEEFRNRFGVGAR